MNRKIVLFLVIIAITSGIVILSQISKKHPMPETVSGDNTKIISRISTPEPAPSTFPAKRTFKTVETDQMAMEEELNSIPSNPVGKIVALANGKEALEIDGKKVMEAVSFEFHEKHPSGNVLIGAISTSEKPLAKFDQATDVVNGSAQVATTDLWWLPPGGQLRKLTSDNQSVDCVRMSDSGKKLAFSVSELNPSRFRAFQALYVFDVPTGKVTKLFQVRNTGQTFGPVSWLSDDSLRVHTADEHGQGIKIETISVK